MNKRLDEFLDGWVFLVKANYWGINTDCCQSTFYKYCRLLGITRNRIKRPEKYCPFVADEILSVLHQDITLFPTINGVRHYIYVIRDNFSRAILACKVATGYSSEMARQTLEGVLQWFDLMDNKGTLVTDDGMENKGKLEKWFHKPGMLWKKFIAQLDIIQSNSMVKLQGRTYRSCIIGYGSRRLRCDKFLQHRHRYDF